jgi:GNAT superfamily N-acetyltransferase
VSRSNDDLDAAAEAFLTNAPLHGIDIRNAYATVEGPETAPPHTHKVREVCLAVLGTGRTASLYLSEHVGKNPPASQLHSPLRPLDSAAIERALCVDAIARAIARERLADCALLQALPDPSETSHAQSLAAAGFVNICTLLYMRRAPRANDRLEPRAFALPAGVTIVPVSSLPRDNAEAMLIAAMQQTYIATLDCPELCGLRETRDILASHRATGTYDPSMWWLVLHEGEPAGCAFFSACPQQRMIELVYLGLAQSLRGKGLGKHLLHMGIASASKGHASWPMACAVDVRNASARALYEREGFTGFAQRLAYVKPCIACTV